MDNFTRGFLEIERWLQYDREQYQSVRGKETPFRTEFRFRRGTKHWKYYTCYEDAMSGESRICRYSICGSPVIESPTSQQVQIKGPRGGWKKYKGPANTHTNGENDDR